MYVWGFCCLIFDKIPLLCFHNEGLSPHIDKLIYWAISYLVDYASTVIEDSCAIKQLVCMLCSLYCPRHPRYAFTHRTYMYTSGNCMWGYTRDQQLCEELEVCFNWNALDPALATTINWHSKKCGCKLKWITVQTKSRYGYNGRTWFLAKLKM